MTVEEQTTEAQRITELRLNPTSTCLLLNYSLWLSVTLWFISPVFESSVIAVGTLVQRCQTKLDAAQVLVAPK